MVLTIKSWNIYREEKIRVVIIARNKGIIRSFITLHFVKITCINHLFMLHSIQSIRIYYTLYISQYETRLMCLLRLFMTACNI